MAEKKVQFVVNQKTSNAIRCVNWMQQQFGQDATMRDVYLAAANIYNLAPTNFVLVHGRCGEQKDKDLPLSFFWEEVVKLKVTLVCNNCRYSAEDPDLKVTEKQAGRMEATCGICHECEHAKHKETLVTLMFRGHN